MELDGVDGVDAFVVPVAFEGEVQAGGSWDEYGCCEVFSCALLIVEW